MGCCCMLVKIGRLLMLWLYRGHKLSKMLSKVTVSGRLAFYLYYPPTFSHSSAFQGMPICGWERIQAWLSDTHNKLPPRPATVPGIHRQRHARNVADALHPHYIANQYACICMRGCTYLCMCVYTNERLVVTSYCCMYVQYSFDGMIFAWLNYVKMTWSGVMVYVSLPADWQTKPAELTRQSVSHTQTIALTLDTLGRGDGVKGASLGSLMDKNSP